jgi:hypothetical protein
MTWQPVNRKDSCIAVTIKYAIVRVLCRCAGTAAYRN